MTDSPSDPEVHDADNSIGDTDPRWSDLRSQAIMFEQTREEMQWDHMDNIREVVALPMNQRAVDLMMQAPAEVEHRRLKELSLKLDLPPE